ncbi:hypothetical protein ACFLT5_02020 [Chloroflexota bacterium]
MFSKRVFLVILAASTALMVLAVGPRIADTVRALPPIQEAAVSGLTIPYPGRLTDSVGQSAADGAYDFTFALYGTEEGGEALWSEVQKDVSVQDGAFFTSLGKVTGIAAQVMGGGARWLAVGVRGPDETEFVSMSPRLLVDADVSPSASSNGMACPHDHFGETWAGAATESALQIVNTGTGGGLSAFSAQGIGVEGSSTLGSAVRGRSDLGIAIEAAGTGQIRSTADSELFLSPHDMVARELDPSVLELIPLNKGGVKIVNQTGTVVKRYVSLPVSTFGTLFGSQFYVKEVLVCYSTPSANTWIDKTTVIKHDGSGGAAFYIYDNTNMSSDTLDCYASTADPRLPVDNSTWVQFNVDFGDVGSELYIYTVKLTLTQEPN